ncbi:DUF1758 domain-containing protein [Trichonephila clavipes]|nr:DUF1758 domain-containing protein [Trichonephila clavipes]
MLPCVPVIVILFWCVTSESRLLRPYPKSVRDETEFKIEFNIIEEYREKALRIELKSKRVLENIKSKQNNNEGSNSGNNSHLADCENPYKASVYTPRLPEVKLYKFGVQSTKIKSEARELIESFPITNENYPLAIESLVERYGRNELLIDFYVRELLKLVLNNATKKKQDSLSGLYNKLSTQLQALSSLGHLASRCRSQITCQLCSKRHVKFMCPNIECNKSDSLKQDVNDKNINENTVDSLHSRATNEVILQTLVVNVHDIKRERKARAIIDTGSQKSYILRSTAEELGFNLQREEEFRHSLFGGTKTRIAKNGSWIHELKTKSIFLTNIQENTGPIEVLLGADVAGKLITGRREELKTGLVAFETKLGWTLMGKVPRYTDKKDTSMNIVTMLSQEDIPVSSLKDLLRKNLGRSCLSYEELQTLVCECESVMNSRPLTYISEEQELKTLTPSMFLQDIPLNDVPDLDQIQKTNIVLRWRYIQKVRENLKQ